MTETEYKLHKTAWDYFVLTQYDGYKYRNREEDERKKAEGTHPCVDTNGKLRPEYVAFNKAHEQYYRARQKEKRIAKTKEAARKFHKKWTLNALFYLVGSLALGIHTGAVLFYAVSALTIYLWVRGYLTATTNYAHYIFTD